VLWLCYFVVIALASDTPGSDSVAEQSYSDDKGDTNSTFAVSGGAIQVGRKKGALRFKWATLSEVDASGQTVISEDLTQHQYGWSVPKVQDVEGDDRKPTGHQFPGVNFSEPLPNGAWFNVSAWIVQSTVTIGNATVPRNSVKFNIYIGNWSFASSSNSLQLKASLDGEGGDLRGEVRQEVEDGKPATPSSFNETGHWRNTYVTYGIGFFSSPNMAVYDGVSGSVNVTVDLYGAPVVTWTFQSFTNNVSYDPILGSSGAKAVPSFCLLAVLLLCFFGRQ